MCRKLGKNLGLSVFQKGMRQGTIKKRGMRKGYGFELEGRKQRILNLSLGGNNVFE